MDPGAQSCTLHTPAQPRLKLGLEAEGWAAEWGSPHLSVTIESPEKS